MLKKEWPRNLTDEQIFNRIAEINTEISRLINDRTSLDNEHERRIKEKFVKAMTHG